MNLRLSRFALLLALSVPVSVGAAEPVGTRPLGDPGGWVTTKDYPAEPLMNDREGVTRFRLTVNKEGLVSDCEITQSSGTDELDFTTCSLITQRARFSPALDKRGKATVGIYSNSVRWVIPPTVPRPKPSSFQYSFVVEPDGTVSSCEGMEQAAAHSPGVVKGCPAGSFEPLADQTGQPRRQRVRVSQSLIIEDIP